MATLGNQVSLRQNIFPHYTYPMIYKFSGYNPNNLPPTPTNNKVEIKSLLLPKMIFKDSYYIRDNTAFNSIEHKKPIINDDIITKSELNGEMITIGFNMPKNNIRLFLDIGYPPWSWIVQENNYNTGGSVFLEVGTYKFCVRAANGGEGGLSSGSDWSKTNGATPLGGRGKGLYFTLTITTPRNLIYKTGSTGGSGDIEEEHSNNGERTAGGGGGGGGTTVLIFSEPTRIPGIGERTEFCWRGGKRGEGNLLQAEIMNTTVTVVMAVPVIHPQKKARMAPMMQL